MIWLTESPWVSSHSLDNCVTTFVLLLLLVVLLSPLDILPLVASCVTIFVHRFHNWCDVPSSGHPLNHCLHCLHVHHSQWGLKSACQHQLPRVHGYHIILSHLFNSLGVPWSVKWNFVLDLNLAGQFEFFTNSFTSHLQLQFKYSALQICKDVSRRK